MSYRSGRFGFSAAHVAALERHGYLVDSSVAPLFYEAHKGGPDFVEAPLRPYFLAYDSATRPGTSGVLEVPVLGGAASPAAAAPAVRLRPRAAAVHDQARAAEAGPRARAVAAAVVLVARGHDRARPATSRADGEPVLNLLFHSSEAIVGGSPYNRTQAELEAFCDRLERFLAFADRRARRAGPRRSREFRDALPSSWLPAGAGCQTADRCLMRILHVTPHLPPDQAANALLPFQLGTGRAKPATRSSTSRIRRAQARRAAAPAR